MGWQTSCMFWLALLTTALLLRLTALIFRKRRKGTPGGSTVRTLIVLGSGGHTAEMLQLTKKLNFDRYKPLYYVLAEVQFFNNLETTDKTSIGKVESIRGEIPTDCIHRIPRSREVGQSWLSTVFSTAYSIVWSFILVARLRPQLVIANGPGTCFPICLAAFFYRVILYLDTRIIFVESFCRVKSLSMTGKLLYPLADRFIVQWEQLKRTYQRAEYIGIIC